MAATVTVLDADMNYVTKIKHVIRRGKMESKNYWGYRIDNNRVDYFWQELMSKRLRQGWGWQEGQDLRVFTVDDGAGRNRKMFNEVKAGDILLVVNLPRIRYISIVEAIDDWDNGYDFDIDENIGDYGHIFPARYITFFSRYDEREEEMTIKECLRNQSRFWNIGSLDCRGAIDRLLSG
jgi:hypothetical protein